MQDHDQTAGHHSGLQQLLPSELFLNQSISEDRHKESRLCTALQAHKSTHQELRLGTGWAHTAFRELSSAAAFPQLSHDFSDFLSLSSLQSRTFQVTTGTSRLLHRIAVEDALKWELQRNR